MIRDCARFDAWLDAGRDASAAASANAHAAACPRCAGALELEAMLADPPAVAAGAAFTERVFFRVRDAERARAAARLVFPGVESPWWLRAPAEPSAALALTVAALLAWRGDGLWSFALALSLRVRAHDWSHGPGSDLLGSIGNAGSLAGSLAGSGTLASGALLTVVLATLALGSWALYRAAESCVSRWPVTPLRHLSHAR